MDFIDADAMCELCGEPNPIKCSNCKVPQMERVDAVPVVRCKDCKWYNTKNHHIICELHSEIHNQYSSGFDMQMLPDDFCSYGERKDGDG